MDIAWLQLIDTQLEEHKGLKRIWFANATIISPPFSYQANYPRLEWVLDGEYCTQMGTEKEEVNTVTLQQGDALYVAPRAWHNPQWEKPCRVLSVLFEPHQLCLRIVHKTPEALNQFDIQEQRLSIRMGDVLTPILSALNTLAKEPLPTLIAPHLLLALLNYVRLRLSTPQPSNKKRGEDLYQGICLYIQKHFHQPINRDAIAQHFNMTPNHLSRLFRQQGHIRLADYICATRLENAKLMLNAEHSRLADVATHCGFHDINYFCRVFKNKTGCTPSQYRLSNKNAL